MKKILNLICILMLTNLAHGFVPPTSLKKQVQIADAVARVVVIEIKDLDFSDEEKESCFSGLAKCRIVTDYTGSFKGSEFIYIPCNYNFDEDPSSLFVGEECIVCLETMKYSKIAHPISYDAIHEISVRKLADPESEDPKADISIVKFEAIIKKHLKAKKALAVKEKEK